jgi:esterase/lipase
MATFVLIHGTGCGGWDWMKLSTLLRTAGYDVYTPTLTGLSGRSHLLTSSVNLTTHITDVVNLLFYEDLFDVILVGKSYAGMVITGVIAKSHSGSNSWYILTLIYQMVDKVKLICCQAKYLPRDKLRQQPTGELSSRLRRLFLA